MGRPDTRTLAKTRRLRLMKLIPPRLCAGTVHETGEPCGAFAVVGATVCGKHGAGAPQVRAKAAERITLAEALLMGDRRHPQEVLASALHQVDVLAGQTVQSLADGQLTAETFEQLLEASKTQATMAKLVLDAAGAEGWSAQEAYRQQADALAKICRAMVRRLGLDPADQRVAEAFEAAVAEVLYGKRGRRALKAIEGSAP